MLHKLGVPCFGDLWWGSAYRLHVFSEVSNPNLTHRKNARHETLILIDSGRFAFTKGFLFCLVIDLRDVPCELGILGPIKSVSLCLGCCKWELLAPTSQRCFSTTHKTQAAEKGKLTRARLFTYPLHLVVFRVQRETLTRNRTLKHIRALKLSMQILNETLPQPLDP